MESLEIIDHLIPMANSDKKTKTYKIKDPLVGFWHIVMYPNLDIASSPNREAAYEAMYEEISTYLGHRFEDVCTDYMKRRYLCKKIGKWWGWTGEETSDIDIVAEVVDGKEKYAALA